MRRDTFLKSLGALASLAALEVAGRGGEEAELVDGRRFAAILSPELLAKLVRQSVIVGVAP